jgi:hypothetical protein
MSLTEAFLRLGCSIVAWLMVYTHCLWLATLYSVGCGSDGAEFWRLLLGFAPLTIGFTLLLGATRKLDAVHGTLAWLAIPLIVLLPLAARGIWPTLQSATFNDVAICADGDASLWQVLWAPVQIATLAIIGFVAFRVFRGARHRSSTN